MTELNLGILASLGTAGAWATSAVIHSEITRLLGVRGLLMFRQPLSVFVLIIICLMGGQFVSYPIWAVGMALMSGLVGIAVCDWCFYNSVLLIGIRPTLVAHSLNVCFTALFGVIFMGEILGLQGLIGILISTAGVAIVILAKQRGGVSDLSGSTKDKVLGLTLAIMSALLMAIGIICSKESMILGVPPLMLSLLRNVAACIGIWTCLICFGHLRATFSTFKACPQSIRLFLVGCFFGPVGGIWLSMVALQHAPVAIASTLIGLQPVFLLVISGIWDKRIPSLGAIIGSVVACTGATVLLMR